MNLIQTLREVHEKRLGDGPQVIEVPEWGEVDGEPFRIYFGPPTIAQQDRYLPLILDNKTEGFVELIIARARDANNLPLFRRSQKEELMRILDPHVVSRVGNEMIERDNALSMGEAKKN